MTTGYFQYLQYLNFVAFGVIDAFNLLLDQSLVVSNLGPLTCDFFLDLYDPVGLHLTRIALEVDPHSTSRFNMSSLFKQGNLGLSGEPPPLVTGSGIVSGDPSCRFSLGTVYPIFDTSGASQPAGTGQTALAGEAGLSVPEPSTFNAVSVRKTLSGIDTGVAIANPTAREANITMSLVDEDQKQLAGVDGLKLGALGSVSKFFEEYLAPQVLQGAGEFTGTLFISSDTALGVIAINTLGGFPTSSLPPGIPRP